MRFAWDDLRLFLAVARAGSLAGAARALGVNHSTVFRRLNAFEAGLEARLFERLPEGYLLTAAGEVLKARAERVEEEAQAIERELSGRDVRLSGRLVVTTTETFAHGFLAPMFRDFCKACPGVELELLIGGAFLDLARREADVAIRPTATPPEDLVGRKLGTLRWGLYGSRTYLREYGPFDGMDACGGHRFIGGSGSIGHLASVRWLDERVPPEAMALRTNSILTALGAVRAGTGLAVLPHYMARQESELECVLPLDDDVTTGLWLLVHPDLRHSARVRAFLDFTVRAMKAKQDDL